MKEWFKNLLSASDSVSSKRLGFFITVALICYVTIRETNEDNLKGVLLLLITFALVLVGAAVVEKIRLK